MSNEGGSGSVTQTTSPPKPGGQAPPPTVSATPLPVPAAPPEFGVDLDELESLATAWRTEAGEIAGIQWAGLSHATGEGSAALAALRSCEAPAASAMASIAGRFTTMADLLTVFASQVGTTDSDSAARFNELSER